MEDIKYINLPEDTQREYEMSPIYQTIEIVMWFIAIVIIFVTIVFELTIYNYITKRGKYHESIRCKSQLDARVGK